MVEEKFTYDARNSCRPFGACFLASDPRRLTPPATSYRPVGAGDYQEWGGEVRGDTSTGAASRTLRGNNWICVSAERLDVPLGHGVHVGGGDDGWAVSVGEVEAVAEGGGGEDQGHHRAGGGDADVIQQRAGVV